MFTRNYGTAYVLFNDGRILSENEALDIFRTNLGYVNLCDAPSVGVSFDGNHLMPSVNGMAQTHLAPTFTVKVRGKVEIFLPKIAEQKARQAERMSRKQAKIAEKEARQAERLLKKQAKEPTLAVA